MPKAPFERIFSLADRKKILAKVAKEQIKILIKNSKNDVLELKAEQIDSAFNLYGQLNEFQKIKYRDFDQITALFQVENDRYFLTTRLKIKDGNWVLINDQKLFKFNRRSAFRVYVPVEIRMQFQISSVRNIDVNRRAQVIEFSTTGARLKVNGETRFSVGSTLKGSLQWGKDRVIVVNAHIVHSPEKGIYGIRFVNLTGSLLNQLKMLSIEIQQAIHFG